MEKPALINQTSYIVGVVSFGFSFGVFYYLSAALFASFFGALVSAGMIWLGYIIIRCIYLAITS